MQASAALRLTFRLHRSQKPPATLLILTGQARPSLSLKEDSWGPLTS